MMDVAATLIREGWTDTEIAKELGMDADEVLRYKQTSGLPELVREIRDKQNIRLEFMPVSDLRLTETDAGSNLAITSLVMLQPDEEAAVTKYEEMLQIQTVSAKANYELAMGQAVELLSRVSVATAV